MAAITIVGPDGKEVVIPKIEKPVGVSVEGGAENAVKPTIQNNSTSHGTEAGLNKDGNEGNGDKRKTGIIVAACLAGGLVFGVILAIAHAYGSDLTKSSFAEIADKRGKYQSIQD
ncbi:hypothetical protein BCR33DRAFT_719086 [Rhizoclosmatium globosum]|uniref:Uncharacterized protein n=1 Tax=Rhizoclosmatium globosum TaxID=329046 RepID=A0A1Y2C1R2_9FUNG|nr:hypothetical protein BCR33DRAFT_719086 [Rhizoclosmatium globosum]|eukprot:ORY40982.1 hypothetical protein BCR33DRAFT_719086 [Rhizoclosmatium globosum]